MKHYHYHFLIIIWVLGEFAYAEEHWIWSNRNRRGGERSSFNADHNEQYISRNRREREPTTRRPLPGQLPNDEIDDYVDNNDDNNVGGRNFPYIPNGYFGGQLAGGVGGGFSNNPGLGYGGNGILVGPGGPTGVIGRPQQYYPGGAATGANAGGFPGVLGQGPGGYGGIQGGFPPGALGQPVYPNNFGQNQGFPIGGQGGQYPGSVYTPNGQYPGGNQFGGGIGGGAQYPGVGGGSGIGQYPVSGGQYPVSGGQYPVSGGQYPVSGGGPLFTEGYGLANLNAGYRPTGFGLPQNTFGGFNGFRFGYDDVDQTKRKLQAEDKSASVENVNILQKTVDDKVNKNLKKDT